jgi:hypothetical protein
MVKKALLIGINYKGSESELRGCIQDVRNINQILVENCGYERQNIRVLTEEDRIVPTRKNIEDNINWLLSNSKAGDTLFFQYSGHGASIDDKNGDERDRKDEIIIPVDYKTNGVITDDWLYTNLACAVPEGVTLWAFTDCCHSGTILDLKYNYKSLCQYQKGNVVKGMPYIFNDWSNRFAFSLEKSKGTVKGNVCLFSGCQDPQTSADAYIERKFQGAFTYCFIQFVKGNLRRNANGTFSYRNGTVKLRNVLKEINCRLDINGFSGQDSQLSIAKQTDLERTLDL